jgi:hypothetical protein
MIGADLSRTGEDAPGEDAPPNAVFVGWDYEERFCRFWFVSGHGFSHVEQNREGHDFSRANSISVRDCGFSRRG